MTIDFDNQFFLVADKIRYVFTNWRLTPKMEPLGAQIGKRVPQFLLWFGRIVSQ